MFFIFGLSFTFWPSEILSFVQVIPALIQVIQLVINVVKVRCGKVKLCVG